MVLPLYLAMTAAEMKNADTLPRHWGIFDPAGEVPPEAMVILTDRVPPRIPEAAKAMNCAAVLLDFEKKADADSRAAANALLRALPCPAAAPPGFCADSDCPVFLPPCPLHVPLAQHLHPWQGRELWLDVTLQQQTITVTRDGTQYGPAVPADRQDGGWFDEILLCRCITEIFEDEVRFTLFDTSDTLKAKLEHAAALGVTKAVGLYQELNGKLQFAGMPPRAIRARDCTC